MMRHQEKPSLSGVWGTVTLIIFLTALPGCERHKPIKVGFVGGLTGQFADLGTAGRNGVLLALEEWNEAGGIQGRPIVLMTKDDEQNADTARAVDQELIDEGVVAIIGHMTSTMALETLPVINKAQILAISPTASSTELSGLDDYFIRLVVPYSATTERLALYAFHQLGLRKIAIVYDLSNHAFSQMAHDNFREQFIALGGEIVHSEPFHTGPDVEYLRLTELLVKSSPESILMIGGALDTAMLCQHIRMAAPDLPILASGWAATQELVQHGGSAVEGLVFVVSEDNERALYLDFQERFAERFGHKPGFAAAYGYNAAKILFEALSIDDDPEKLKETILQQENFQGVQAEIRFDAYGDPQREHFVVTIRNGKRTVLE